MFRCTQRDMLAGTLDPRYDEIIRVLREIVVPLVESDGGEVYLVSADESCVAIHFTGRLSGAPGIGLLGRRIVEPAVKAVAPDTTVALSSGWKLPEGAIRVQRNLL
jgi:Fe-S cluster biogenesis protein NfuA